MKRSIRIISLFIIVLSMMLLVGCKKEEVNNENDAKVRAPNKGSIVSSVELTDENGNKVTVTKNIDPIQLYNLLNNICNTNYYMAFNYTDELKDDYGIDINGTFANIRTQEGNDSFTGNFFFLEKTIGDVKYSYSTLSETIRSDFTYFNRRGEVFLTNDKVYFGGVIQEPSYNLYLFKNGNSFVRSSCPSLQDATSTQEEKTIEFAISTNKARQFMMMYDYGFTNFVVEELIDEFTYNIELTDKYIIFSVSQPYGIYSPSHIAMGLGLEKGTYNKTIYFNTETYEIDYTHSYGEIYTHPGYYGILCTFDYECSKIDKTIVEKQIDELNNFIDENAVRYN